MLTLANLATLGEELRQHATYYDRVKITAALGIAGGVYVHAVLRRLPPGTTALLAAVPLVILNYAVPLLFDPVAEICTRACVLLLLMWLGSFKVRSSAGRLTQQLAIQPTVTAPRSPFHPARHRRHSDWPLVAAHLWEAGTWHRLSCCTWLQSIPQRVRCTAAGKAQLQSATIAIDER